jgi:very-short-patch-repair endonuclease
MGQPIRRGVVLSAQPKKASKPKKASSSVKKKSSKNKGQTKSLINGCGPVSKDQVKEKRDVQKKLADKASKLRNSLLTNSPVKKGRQKVVEQKIADVESKQEYGTSSLEEKFAREFLDKLGVSYIYQFKAEAIGRYFDFRVVPGGPIIEVDGDYWHGYNILYENMDAIQKKNYRVDIEKNRWCLSNGIPIIRIWEHDIHKHPRKVINLLKRTLGGYVTKDPYMKKKGK